MQEKIRTAQDFEQNWKKAARNCLKLPYYFTYWIKKLIYN